ncbi:MAG: DUF2752 domain-containing protein [Actinomycetota bacterium]|nr:DUF2752 domain-containing protein [Actinomycetota bacterium]
MAVSGAGKAEIGQASPAMGRYLEGPDIRRGRKFLSREAEIMGAGFTLLAVAFLYPYLEGFVSRVTPGCLFHRITGLPCLLCGMTRSLAATAHGDIIEAFRLHLLGPPLLSVALVITVLMAAEKITSRRLLPRPERRARKVLARGTLGLLIAAWVARLTLFGVNI